MFEANLGNISINPYIQPSIPFPIKKELTVENQQPVPTNHQPIKSTKPDKPTKPIKTFSVNHNHI
jgi:hypothetical protein